jgi:hypothetical protein
MDFTHVANTKPSKNLLNATIYNVELILINRENFSMMLFYIRLLNCKQLHYYQNPQWSFVAIVESYEGTPGGLPNFVKVI